MIRETVIEWVNIIWIQNYTTSWQYKEYIKRDASTNDKWPKKMQPNLTEIHIIQNRIHTWNMASYECGRRRRRGCAKLMVVRRADAATCAWEAKVATSLHQTLAPQAKSPRRVSTGLDTSLARYVPHILPGRRQKEEVL